MNKKESDTLSETPEDDKEASDTSSNAEASSTNEAETPKPEAVKEVKKEDFKSLYLRSVADLENFRKRVAKDKQDIIKMANGSLIESLLPVIDTMKLGLQAADNQPEAADIKKGFEMVLEQLNRALQENGLVELSPDGSLFDPNLHESISYQASDTVPEDHVIQTVRSGYTLNDRLIRAANVIVSSGKETS
ncbi:MAG: nucleotide exchange factor GrpE [Opitutae bacterium]|nr:nucleotide exchange factor GrpE [Opitutae bacterium]